jgi:hypothetical protein
LYYFEGKDYINGLRFYCGDQVICKIGSCKTTLFEYDDDEYAIYDPEQTIYLKQDERIVGVKLSLDSYTQVDANSIAIGSI